MGRYTYGEGCPLPIGVGVWGGAVPLPENFKIFKHFRHEMVHLVVICSLVCLVFCSMLLGRVALVRGVAASRQTFPVTICRSVGPWVRRSVQCIVEKRRIGSGCRLVL